MNKIKPELGAFDYFLAAIGAVLATFSVGMAVGKPTIAAFLSSGVLITIGVGFMISRSVRKTDLANYDGYLWAGLAITCWMFVRDLNAVLPEEGFPFRLVAAAALCWMLILCSLVSWRDQTLLFLSLPCIALFGLVGTFDTYRPATGLFFIFLVASGVLYARVHQRGMLIRAGKAGNGDPTLLRRGPWKWMAGPEWAMASGFLVILLSLVGAPALQMTVKNVAGQIKISLPTPSNSQTSSVAGSTSSYFIGRGPNRATDAPVFKIKGDGFFYVLERSLSKYTGSSWGESEYFVGVNSELDKKYSTNEMLERGPNGGFAPWPNTVPPGEEIDNPRLVPFELEPVRALPLHVMRPGPIVELISPTKEATFYSDGSVGYLALPLNTNIKAVAAMARSYNIPIETEARVDPDLDPAYKDTGNISPAVAQLAADVTRPYRTDLQKAQAIKTEIERRVKYNLNAEKIPSGEDAVYHFLFKSKEGYCDLFASSMVMMARSVDLPARYVLGYIADGEKDKDGFVTVRERDYHAWAEIHFEGYGWVPFDPTEGAQAVPGGERGSTSSARGPIFSDENLRLIGTVFIVFALAFPITVYGLRAAAMFTKKDVRVKTELNRQHSRFVRMIEREVKSPKRFSSTLQEFTANYATQLGSTANEASLIAGDFDEMMFSPRIPEATNIRELSARITKFKEALSRRTPQEA
jgi:hypothetical protein